MRRNLLSLVVVCIMALFGAASSVLAAAPMLTPLDGGSATPLCIATSATQAPAFGQALVGTNGSYVVFEDGEATDFRIAEEGRGTGHFPTLIVERGTINAPACGPVIVEGSNGVYNVNGFCFAEHEANTPSNRPCMTGD